MGERRAEHRVPHVLIVEDDPLLAADLRLCFEQAGYSFLSHASTGEQAVAAARAQRPDVVLMDIVLAGAMTGVDAAVQIRAEADVPIVFLTAHTEGGAIEDAKRADPYGYLTKPLQRGDVLSTLQMAVHRAEIDRSVRRASVAEREALRTSIVEYDRRLKNAALAAARADEGQRRRLAEALHDRLAQSLALTQQRLRSALVNLSGPSRDEVDAALSLLDDAVTDTRSLMTELSPPIVYDLGLVTALHWLADEFGRKHNLAVEVVDDGAIGALDDFAASVLFRAVRECLINIVKHAHSKTARVSLRRTDANLEVAVEDRGIGFPSDLRLPHAQSEHFGLQSVYHQVSVLGGTMELDSARGLGARARLCIPFASLTAPKTRPDEDSSS